MAERVCIEVDSGMLSGIAASGQRLHVHMLLAGAGKVVRWLSCRDGGKRGSEGRNAAATTGEARTG